MWNLKCTTKYLYIPPMNVQLVLMIVPTYAVKKIVNKQVQQIGSLLLISVGIVQQQTLRTTHLAIMMLWIFVLKMNYVPLFINK